MPIEHFPPRTPENSRPPLPQPVGTWAEAWADALWQASRTRYRAMSPERLLQRATEAQERAEAMFSATLRQLEKAHGPAPKDPLSAMQWRAPLVNQARELVAESLLGELAESAPPE